MQLIEFMSMCLEFCIFFQAELMLFFIYDALTDFYLEYSLFLEWQLLDFLLTMTILSSMNLE